MSSEPIYSFAALQNRLIVSGQLVALTGLRIGAGRDSDVTGNDLPVLRDVRGRPFIPGASLKGAFRARIEALVAAAGAPGRDLEQVEAFMRQDVATTKQRVADDPTIPMAEKDTVLSRRLWSSSTLIELTFGAPWMAGRIFFRDAAVDPQLWFGQFEVRNGVAIDRDTETVSDAKLYDYEVVPAGTRFDFRLTLENAADWQLGMVLLALRPWQSGDVQIGGFRSRGLGFVRLEEMRATYAAIRGAASVIALLEGEGRGDDVTDQQRGAWRDAFARVLGDPRLATKELADA